MDWISNWASEAPPPHPNGPLGFTTALAIQQLNRGGADLASFPRFNAGFDADGRAAPRAGASAGDANERLPAATSYLTCYERIARSTGPA
jgi:hypothetical protein